MIAWRMSPSPLFPRLRCRRFLVCFLQCNRTFFFFFFSYLVSVWVQIEMIQDSNLSKFKSEVKSSQVTTTYTFSILHIVLVVCNCYCRLIQNICYYWKTRNLKHHCLMYIFVYDYNTGLLISTYVHIFMSSLIWMLSSHYGLVWEVVLLFNSKIYEDFINLTHDNLFLSSLSLRVLGSFFIWCCVKTFLHLVLQEHHFTVLQRETEKLRGDIEKMRSELRFCSFLSTLSHIPNVILVYLLNNLKLRHLKLKQVWNW